MKISHCVAAAALVSSCLFAVAADAAPIGADRVAVTTRVSHAGLDLSTALGRKAFGVRVRRAARAACGNGSALGTHNADQQRCMDEMVADASVQVAALTGTTGVELASVTR